MSKVAFVSGGSSGIGKQIIIDFMKQGYNVGFNYRRKSDSVEELIDLQKEYDVKVFAYQCDVSDYKKTQIMAADFIEKNGHIDVLVNNAGITNDGLFLRMEEDQFKSVIDINLNGTFNLCKHFSKHMMKNKSGNIINMSSVIGIHGNIGQANYASSKAGIIGLSKSLAKELGRFNIRCNVIAPGFIDTRMSNQLDPRQIEEIKKKISLQRLGTVQDVSNLVMFLASDASSYISGSVIEIDGCMQ